MVDMTKGDDVMAVQDDLVKAMTARGWKPVEEANPEPEPDPKPAKKADTAKTTTGGTK